MPRNLARVRTPWSQITRRTTPVLRPPRPPAAGVTPAAA
ncbi:hypothetical protein SCATT_17770 [Streptantibioticus cattleyicolor NRRL 8057 = DSM 46488]|uniref:Uncharacterized protein n=1 Tax=Streptantibioticus cattleyicolor (strain ATCC 35852 / DSM 46488 / JCM 4925 / NBRC 14057 / NRRL 8057) TaxID=1003195 RepID=G8WQ87_STREN|nr:hypothetical protein SCATT_17770 [Streptantibioticus cattleyicolor NRRL 8057 = DSM 46488]